MIKTYLFILIGIVTLTSMNYGNYASSSQNPIQLDNKDSLIYVYSTITNLDSLEKYVNDSGFRLNYQLCSADFYDSISWTTSRACETMYYDFANVYSKDRCISSCIYLGKGRFLIKNFNDENFIELDTVVIKESVEFIILLNQKDTINDN